MSKERKNIFFKHLVGMRKEDGIKKLSRIIPDAYAIWNKLIEVAIEWDAHLNGGTFKIDFLTCCRELQISPQKMKKVVEFFPNLVGVKFDVSLGQLPGKSKVCSTYAGDTLQITLINLLVIKENRGKNRHRYRLDKNKNKVFINNEDGNGIFIDPEIQNLSRPVGEKE